MALLAGWSPADTVIEGVNLVRSAKPETLAFARASLFTTVTESGIFWRFSFRFWAVTTTSWTVCASEGAAA